MVHTHSRKSAARPHGHAGGRAVELYGFVQLAVVAIAVSCSAYLGIGDQVLRVDAGHRVLSGGSGDEPSGVRGRGPPMVRIDRPRSRTEAELPVLGTAMEPLDAHPDLLEEVPVRPRTTLQRGRLDLRPADHHGHDLRPYAARRRGQRHTRGELRIHERRRFPVPRKDLTAFHHLHGGAIGESPAGKGRTADAGAVTGAPPIGRRGDTPVRFIPFARFLHRCQAEDPAD